MCFVYRILVKDGGKQETQKDNLDSCHLLMSRYVKYRKTSSPLFVMICKIFRLVTDLTNVLIINEVVI